MARIRSVHPGLFTDEAFASVSPLARILWIGIWTECDDQGAFEWKPLTLKMRILPGDNADVPALLAELASSDMVRSYTVGGRHYGLVRNFARFQRPKKPQSVHPIPDEFRTFTGSRVANSEPDDDEGGGGSPPPPPSRRVSSPPEPISEGLSSPPVPHRFPTGGEIPPQMEDGGWRREEIPPSPPSEAQPPRGTRLPDNWRPNEVDAAFARDLGLDVEAVEARFRDHWRAKPGKDGRKADWSATWRNWCRRDADGAPTRREPQSKSGWLLREMAAEREAATFPAPRLLA
jgi:hypothetical protein